MNLFFDLSLIFDLFLLIITGCFIFLGARKGTASCLFTLIALLVAYPTACYFFPLFSSLFSQKVTDRILGDAIAFAVTLVFLYFCILILIWAVLEVFKRFREDISDQIAGGILGLLKGVVIAFIAILLMITFLPSKSPFIKNSFLSRSTIYIVDTISKPFPISLKRKFIQKKKELELHWKQTQLTGGKGSILLGK